ncbi:MAG: HK97 family phage prohead protease [Proteobacteria bacterium]|nr:HK97 family phage prohead protease [Pseudomonadota bacterium]
MTIHHLNRPLAIKSLGQDGIFVGYASVFDTVDSQSETVERGAFTRTLAAWRVKGSAPAMLWMHDPTAPIGVWLAMSEDAKGLVVQGRLALSTQKGREAYELLKMKALTGLSIGYRVVSSKIDKKRKVRILSDVELFEILLVTFPANDKARVDEVKAPRRRVATEQKRKLTARGQSTRPGTDKEKTRAVVSRLNHAAKTLKQTTKKGK